MFDRKNYYYPDLPKGYQITQMEKPVGVDGYVMINVNGEDKKIGIHDIHLEEDTASMEHFSDYSLLDYNRAGLPRYGRCRHCEHGGSSRQRRMNDAPGIP